MVEKRSSFRRGECSLGDAKIGVHSNDFIYNESVKIDNQKIYTINGHDVSDLQQQTVMKALRLYYGYGLDIDVVYYGSNEVKKCRVILQEGEGLGLEEIGVELVEEKKQPQLILKPAVKNPNYWNGEAVGFIIGGSITVSAILGFATSYGLIHLVLNQSFSSFMANNFNIKLETAEVIFSMSIALLCAAIAATISTIIVCNSEQFSYSGVVGG